MLNKRCKIHILPWKGLRYETIRNGKTAALIVCTGNSFHFQTGIDPENVCAVSFEDVTDPSLKTSIKEEQAVRIRDFVFEPDLDITDLYICCDSGESRSPAVAAAILTAGGVSDAIIWNNPFYAPNTLVYQRVCRAFGIDVCDERLAAKKQKSEEAYRAAQQMKDAGGFSRRQIIDLQLLQVLDNT